MNKLAYIVVASALAVAAYGQGQVNANNRGLTPAQLVTDSTGTPLTGASFVAQIVYGADASSLNTALDGAMPFRVAPSANAGTWNPAANGAAAVRTLTGFAQGATVSMQVRVWDSAVFSSWDAAATALSAGSHSVATQAGSSAVFTYTVGSPTDAAALAISNFRGFQLTAIPQTVVPEPTTIALGALGAAALLWRRRK